MITLQEIKQNESIKALVRAGNRYLEALGYTDHGPRHLGYVSRTASGILKSLGYSEREVELAAIAGWVHDVGNSVNRHDHGPNGAILLFPLLREIGMDIEDVMIIITAVGNHEEQSGTVSSAVSAALAIADKSDAHKSRVRNGRPDVGDIHDRVNFAIQENSVIVDRKHKIIRQELKMDESSSVLEYLSIYLPRILMCEKAAEFLGQQHRQRHPLRRLVSGIAHHDPLIACAQLVTLAHGLRDVGRLLVQPPFERQAAVRGQFVHGVAHLRAQLLQCALHVHAGLCSDLARYQNLAVRRHDLNGRARVGISPEAFVQQPVRQLVAELVRVPRPHGLGGYKPVIPVRVLLAHIPFPRSS